ncbi:hypothetical protein GJ496_008744 [Pomphorhynchus laevis]|nr:hypothetical protein GJ496_008744 [Pomphorhynchus laevis]
MNLRTFACEQENVALCSSSNETTFRNGSLRILNETLTWIPKSNEDCAPIIFYANQIGIATEDWSAERPRIILHLVGHSSENKLTLEFPRDNFNEVFTYIKNVMIERRISNLSSSRFKFKGITAIERSISENLKIQEQSISEAFTDLQMLMNSAGKMAELAKSIAAKLQDNQKRILDSNDIAKFRSYLLSLGMVANPVVKGFTSRDFHKQLCVELSEVIRPFINRYGGLMNLVDVYCVLNRARGLDPISPSDLANACELLPMYSNDIRLVKFDSGVHALEITSPDESSRIIEAVKENHGHITANIYASKANLSQMLALEHLHRAEQNGILCRDESLSNLCFYPNIFLHDFSWFKIN